MTGRERCEFLRNIRKNIAELNGLSYTPHECTHEGWCPGYCPACDAESEDLMRQLEKREASGAAIKIDVESIKALDEMAREPEDIDDDFEPGDKLLGDISAPGEEELSGIMAPPQDWDEDKDIHQTMGMPSMPDEELDRVHKDTERHNK